MSGLLDIVAEHVPPELVDTSALPGLLSMLEALPLVESVGFECRLGANDGQVDVQLGAFGAHGDASTVLRFLGAAGAGAHHGGAWAGVRRLCEQWDANGSDIARSVDEVWLEFDRPDGDDVGRSGVENLVPSAFAVVGAASAARSAQVIHAVLGCLVATTDRGVLEPVLDTWLAACPPGARLSHVGVMTARAVVAIRLHVSGVPLNHLEPFLRAIGWTGDTRTAHELARLLLVYGDSLVLCFDLVDGHLLPRLGLECFFTQRVGVDPRWAPLLDRLVELGLATPAKAAALQGWPGIHTPAQTAGPWPEAFIIASLVRPAHELGTIERRLSHVKLTLTPDTNISAKAYFGMGHVWRRPESPRLPERLTPRAVASGRPVADATEAAVEALLAARNQGGWWRDFFDRGRPRHVEGRVMGYASDEWVTAYVGAALATTCIPRARAAAAEALEVLLERRRHEPGWGYHTLLPPDADSTTWVLRLAASVGAPWSPRLSRATQFVSTLTSSSGGVRTYDRSAAPALVRFLRMPGEYRGWCGEHACVTAAVAESGRDLRSIGYLIGRQHANGSWVGHWWDDDEYTTARAVEALARHGAHPAAVRRGARWAIGRIGNDGAVRSAAQSGPSAFATGLAVQAALTGGASADPAVRRGVRWLVDHQRADGSWEPSARLRVPDSEALDPLASPATTLTYVDDEGLFTAATALVALAAIE